MVGDRSEDLEPLRIHSSAKPKLLDRVRHAVRVRHVAHGTKHGGGLLPCQISIDGVTGRVPLLACPAVLSRESSPSLLDKPAVAPFSSFLATRQSRFDTVLCLLRRCMPYHNKRDPLGMGNAGALRGPFFPSTARYIGSIPSPLCPVALCAPGPDTTPPGRT